MKSRKYKIGYFCPSKSWGGLEMNHLRSANWMQERGHDITVFVQKDSRAYQEAVKMNLSIELIKQHRKYYDLGKAIQLAKKIKKHQITHLLVRDPKDMSVTALTKTWMRGKLNLSFYLGMQLGISKRDFIHTLRYRQFDHWFCPLPWLKKQVLEMTRYPAEKIHIIPVGLDVEKFQQSIPKKSAKKQLNLPEENVYIGLIGRYDIQKGQLLLLEAFQKIKDKIPHDIVFLGEPTQGEENSYYDDLKEYVVSNQLEERVYFLPFRRAVEYFYKAIDVFVMATKSETFGMVTIEALASGCKIVGSDRGGTVEILNHGEFGLLFESMNSDDLAEKLVESIQQENFSSIPQQKESQKYDFRVVCEAIEKTLDL